MNDDYYIDKIEGLETSINELKKRLDELIKIYNSNILDIERVLGIRLKRIKI